MIEFLLFMGIEKTVDGFKALGREAAQERRRKERLQEMEEERQALELQRLRQQVDKEQQNKEAGE